ncbi:MAG TPA: hypothetical protein VGL42_15280 [Opitutaceae bacterium]
MIAAAPPLARDFESVLLSSPTLEVVCVPELGGRVCSLVNRRTGREWLWRRPGEPALFQPADPLDFGTGTFAGLDECFPTVGPGAWVDGRVLPDHGDVWARAWKIGARTPELLELTVESPPWEFRLRRTIQLRESVVHFSYELESLANRYAPALWSMHPLFSIREGDRLELPASVRELRVESSDASVQRSSVLYPEISPGVRLDELALFDLERGYLKAFAGPVWASDARAAIVNRASGESLEVRWDAAAAPYLGLWLTRGGYRGWHHVGIEPTNAPFDRVDLAARDAHTAFAVTLPPRSRRRWWVEWRLS